MDSKKKIRLSYRWRLFIPSVLLVWLVIAVLTKYQYSYERDYRTKIIRNELARVRATRMEGSFGTQKEHYGLKRIKARTKLTEILYIFFGIHTANAVQLVRREVNEIAQAA